MAALRLAGSDRRLASGAFRRPPQWTGAEQGREQGLARSNDTTAENLAASNY